MFYILQGGSIIMIKKRKKMVITTIIIAVFNIVCYLTSNSIYANSLIAQNKLRNHDVSEYDQKIPIYLVEIKDRKQYEKEIKDGTFQDRIVYLKEQLPDETDVFLNFESYSLKKVCFFEASEIIDKNIVEDTYKCVDKILEQGHNVNYITFQINNQQRYSNLDDPRWWEDRYKYITSYEGYKFLFSESSINYTANAVDLLSNHESKTWNSIFKSVINIGINETVDYYSGHTLNLAIDFFKNLFGYSYPDIRVTVRDANGQIDVTPNPTVYLRYFYIEDKLQKIPGYAYYEYGRAQMVKFTTNVFYKIPYKKRPGGWTYDYLSGSKVFRGSLSNKGFYASKEFLEGMIRYYENGTNSKYEESLDWDDIFTELAF